RITDRAESAKRLVNQFKKQVEDTKTNPPSRAKVKEELALLNQKIAQNRKAVDQVKEQLARIKELRAEPRAQELEESLVRTAKEGQELEQLAGDLRRLQGQNVEEFKIQVPATVGNVSSNARKLGAIAFLVPLLCCLGLVLAYDMTSSSWRAETLSTKLD